MNNKIETTEAAVVALLEPCRNPMMRTTAIMELIGFGQFNRDVWPPSKDAAEVIRSMLATGKLTETKDGLSLVRQVEPVERWLF